MDAFSLDRARVEQGPLVLSLAETSVLVLDDGAGQIDADAAGHLMASIGSGDRATVLDAMRQASGQFPAAAAVLTGADRASVLLFGGLTVVVESPSAVVTIEAGDGVVDEIPLPTPFTSLTITPAGGHALGDGQGETASGSAVRVARVRLAKAQPVAPLAVPPAMPPDPGSTVADPMAGASAADAAVAAAAVARAADSDAPSTNQSEIVESTLPPDVLLLDLNAASGDEREPLPIDSDADPGRVQVLGVKCPRGHHNHPGAVYCAQCGLRMGVNQTLVAGLGPRPALGLLLLDDGTTHPIDADMIVGREPHFHALVASGEAVDVTVNDPELNLSREHFAIHLVDWDVTAIDLNSSNGTMLQRKDSDAWSPLSTSEATTVSAGDKLRAGTRVFQIQLHHIQT